MKGQMTIQVSLLFAVMIPLIFLAIEGARLNAMKLHIESVTVMGMDSVLAEYHRGLLQQYDLLFVDTSYGQAVGSTENTVEHFKNYVNYNLFLEEDLPFLWQKDFYGLSVYDVEMTNVSRATDNEGEVFRHMAVSYMLERYGYAYVEDLADLILTSEEEGIFQSDIQSENQSAQAAINAIEIPPPQEESEEEWTPVEVENPTEGVNEIRRRGILSLVCEGEISGATITPGLYASGRSLVVGNGLSEETDRDNDLLENLLFQEYIMLHCGCYGAEREGGLLKYELEYIFGGESNDTENLRKVANRLLLIRGGANTAYFFTDTNLRTQAKTMATTLSVVVALPELEAIFEAAIIAAWIYAESLYDVKLLFLGEKVPLIKTAEDWNLSLENALGISPEMLGQAAGASSQRRGLDYQDYLRLLLYLIPPEEKTMRMMDVVEMNIRQLPGEENFRLDHCIMAATIQIVYTSEFGYEFLVTRTLGYR